MTPPRDAGRTDARGAHGGCLPTADAFRGQCLVRSAAEAAVRGDGFQRHRRTPAASNMAAEVWAAAAFRGHRGENVDGETKRAAGLQAPDTHQIHLAVAQFKAQRAQGKSLPRRQRAEAGCRSSSMAISTANPLRPSPASRTERSRRRAQSLQEDPATANAVISLLNSEASKRASTADHEIPPPTANPATTALQRTTVTGNPARARHTCVLGRSNHSRHVTHYLP